MAEKITGDSLLKDAASTVADKLTLAWNYIDGHPPLPERGKMEEIAAHLLKTKKLVVDGKELLNLEKLNEEQKDAISAFGVDVKSLEAFASKQKRDKLADSIDKGVQEVDGSWLAKAFNFIKGLFSWIGSGFRGGLDGLWKEVREANAEAVTQSVHASVNKAMEEDPSLKVFASSMGTLDRAVHDKVMHIATDKEPPKHEAPTPLPVQSEAIRERVMAQLNGETDARIRKNGELNDNLTALLKSGDNHTQERVDQVKNMLADFAMKTGTDKNFVLGDGKKVAAAMSDEEFKTALKQKLVVKFKAVQVTDQDGKQVALTDWYKDNWTGGPIVWSARQLAGLPGEPDKLAEHLADKTLSGLPPEALAGLKQSRGLAEKDFKLNLSDILDIPAMVKAQTHGAVDPNAKPTELTDADHSRNQSPTAKYGDTAPSVFGANFMGKV